MPHDAENVFITLTGRQMCPKFLIIARAEQPSTLKKLRQAGADHVVLPAAIGAHRIVSLVTNPAAVEFAELVTQRTSLAIEMDEMPILATHALAGHSVRDADIERRTGVIVVAIKRADGRSSSRLPATSPRAGRQRRLPGPEGEPRPVPPAVPQGVAAWNDSPRGSCGAITAWRTGSSCGPSCGRTSSARPSGRRGSGSRRRGGPSRRRGGAP